MSEEIFQQLILAVSLAVVSLIAFGLRSFVQVGVDYLRSRIADVREALAASLPRLPC